MRWDYKFGGQVALGGQGPIYNEGRYTALVRPRVRARLVKLLEMVNHKTGYEDLVRLLGLLNPIDTDLLDLSSVGAQGLVSECESLRDARIAIAAALASARGADAEVLTDMDMALAAVEAARARSTTSRFAYCAFCYRPSTGYTRYCPVHRPLDGAMAGYRAGRRVVDEAERVLRERPGFAQRPLYADFASSAWDLIDVPDPTGWVASQLGLDACPPTAKSWRRWGQGLLRHAAALDQILRRRYQRSLPALPAPRQADDWRAWVRRACMSLDVRVADIAPAPQLLVGVINRAYQYIVICAAADAQIDPALRSARRRTGRPQSGELRDQVRDLVAGGVTSAAEVGRRLGVSRQRAHVLLKQVRTDG